VSGGVRRKDGVTTSMPSRKSLARSRNGNGTQSTITLGP